MAIDYINVNTASPQGRSLIDYSRQLRVAYDQGKRLLGIMSHANAPPDFSKIESLYGLDPGMGSVVFDLINGSVGSMQGDFQVSDARDITERIA